MKRYINPLQLLEKNSHFIFGPRGTGKSYLMRTLGKNVNYIDLLSSRTYLDLNNDPSQLENYISKNFVVIDEIQRIPDLLNEVHRLIELKNIKFLLTGSSARKMKKAGVNLLAGRAFRTKLFGLSWHEISKEAKFDLNKYLLFGGLPYAYLGDQAEDYLHAYTDTYLREEIQAEAFVKNLSNYSRFLETAALSNAEMINFTKIGNDSHVPPNTIRDYYQLLEDTLLGQILAPWNKSLKRKAIQTPKFYFFDIGLVHSLKNISKLERNTDVYGKAFEHFIYSEIRTCLAYNNRKEKLTYWRSKNNQEVDFIIGDNVAIEVKSSKKVSERDHKSLIALAEEKPWKELLIVSHDTTKKSFSNGIKHIYWELFLQNLWKGKYF